MGISAIRQTCLAHPLQSSLLLMDFGLLIVLPLIRPPVFLTLILVTALVCLAYRLGQQVVLEHGTSRPELQ